MRALLRFAFVAAAAGVAADDTDKTATTTVLVIGDSLSAGYGLRDGESWVDLLRERLGLDYKVVNASISGDTTGGGLARIGKTLDEHEPDIVIIELGGNDGLRGLPIETIRDNLMAMAEAVVAVDAQPVLAGMLMPPNLGPRYTEAFQQVYEEVAEATGAALVPFLLEGVALSEEGLMQDDGVHPTAAAQVRLLDNVWRVLAPLVTEQSQGTVADSLSARSSAHPVSNP